MSEARPARPPAVRRLLARRPRAPRAPLPRAPPAARGARPRSPTRRRSPRPRRRSSPPASPRSPTRPPTAFLGREKSKLATRDHEPVRVALVADGIGGMHGVTHTLDEIRERGVPGFEVEVIGTDPHVDRRLSAVAEVEIPFYAGLKIGVPSLPAVVEALAEGRYGVLHLCSPGPAGVAAAMIGRVHASCRSPAPTTPSWPPTRRCARATTALAAGVEVALGAFYGGCDVGALALARVATRGCARSASTTRDRPLGPRRRRRAASPPHCATRAADGRVRVLYAGRLTKEKGVDLLADAFLAARARDPRLELVLAGGGPEEDALRARLGCAATFLGWLEGEALARAYADADLFLFCSQTDTFGQVVLEAQASGLPVVAVDAGGPSELIASGRSGVLCPPRTSALADAVAGLAAHPGSRRRLATRRPRRRPRTHLGGLARRPRRRLAPRPGRPRRRRRGSPRGMTLAGDERARAHRACAPNRGRPRHARRPRPSPARAAARQPPAAARRRRRRVLRRALRRHPHLSRRQGRVRPAHRRVRAPADRARRARDVSGDTCALPSVRVATSNGYRWPLGTRPARRPPARARARRRAAARPVLGAAGGAARVGAPVVMVHHGSLDLDAAALPGPPGSTGRRSARWLRSVYARRRRRHVRLRPARRHRPRGDAAAALRPRPRVLPRGRRASAASTSSTPAGWAARRASSSCSRRPR